MQDILLTEDYDIMIDGNDIVQGESTLQHQQLLIVCQPGDFKETPAACVGAAQWLKDDDVTGMLAEIKSNFEQDGMTVKNIQYNNGKLSIDASY